MAYRTVILLEIGVQLAVSISRKLEAQIVQLELMLPPGLRDIVDMMALSRSVIEYLRAIRQGILDDIHGCMLTLRLRRPARSLVNIWYNQRFPCHHQHFD